MIKRTVSLVLASAWLALLSGDVLAQASQCGVQRDVKPRPLDEGTWNRLNRIYEYVGEEDYDSAYKELISLQNRSEDKGDYLNAIIYQALGQVQWSLEDYDGALRSFEQAVARDALPNDPHFSLMYQLAQLYYMKERFRDALDNINLWLCKVAPEKIKPDAYVLKASVLAQMKKWPEVIEAIDRAIQLEPEPKEGWYTLRLAANYELEDFPAAAETLEFMVRFWPDKKMYWTMLSNIWFKLEQDEKALSVIALAHRKKLLDKQVDYLYLANLYQLAEVPFKAAAVLEEGVNAGIVESSEKHWTFIADSWYSAEELERALVAYEKAGRASKSGELDLRRGYILIDLERWAEARDALRLALNKGGLNDRKTGEAHLMVGMSEFNLGNWDRASAAWGRASRYERSKKSAEQWMNLLREERARKAS